MRMLFVTFVLSIAVQSSIALAQVQRMMIPQGTQAKLIAKGSTRVAARCVDPHLAGPIGERFTYVAEGTQAFVRLSDGRETSLSRAIADGQIEVIGDYPDLQFVNLTNLEIDIRFESPSVLASSEIQTRELAELQRHYSKAGAETPSIEEAWHLRYDLLLERAGYDATDRSVSIHAFQNDWGFPSTGEYDYTTTRALNQFLSTAESCRVVTKDDGKVITIKRMRSMDEPMFRLIDTENALPFREEGNIFETDSIEQLRAAILEMQSSLGRVEYIRMVGFEPHEVQGFSSSLRLADINAVGQSQHFFTPGARLTNVSLVARDADGFYHRTLSFRVSDKKFRLRISAKLRSSLDTIVASVERLFSGSRSDLSVRAAVREAKKAAKESGLQEMRLELEDEFGGAQFVHLFNACDPIYDENFRLAYRHGSAYGHR